jgi:hypothetical protein
VEEVYFEISNETQHVGRNYLILEIVGETVDGVDFDAPPIKYYFN